MMRDPSGDTGVAHHRTTSTPGGVNGLGGVPSMDCMKPRDGAFGVGPKTTRCLPSGSHRVRSTTISSGFGSVTFSPGPVGSSTTFIGGDAVTVETHAPSGESECPSPVPRRTGGEPSLALRYVAYPRVD